MATTLLTFCDLENIETDVFRFELVSHVGSHPGTAHATLWMRDGDEEPYEVGEYSVADGGIVAAEQRARAALAGLTEHLELVMETTASWIGAA